MTFDDLQVVERHATAVANEMGVDHAPVMRPAEYDRVDIDTTYMPGADIGEFIERLTQSLRKQGYAWDVWLNGLLVSVSEKEAAE